MKKTITLNFDPATGQITDANGTFIGTNSFAVPVEPETGVSIDEICKLRNAGFTAEEIIELYRKEVI